MSQLPIDIDAEAIYFDGHWYTRDDMARKIKAMLDQGDFAITRPSSALEQLTSVVASVRTLAFRATPDMVDALNAGAARTGKSVGAFIRDSLSPLLGLPTSDFGPARPGTDPLIGSKVSNEEAKPAADAANGGATPSTGQAPIAGPGALKSAQNERLPSVVVEPALIAESPVELTQKKTKEEETTAERRWFNS